MERNVGPDPLHGGQERLRPGVVLVAVRGPRGVRIRREQGQPDQARAPGEQHPGGAGGRRRVGGAEGLHGEVAVQQERQGRLRRAVRADEAAAGGRAEQAGGEGGGGLPGHAAGDHDVAVRRRRLGVRYRLRGSGPRAGLGREREDHDSGHGDVREHGRPAVEVHADVRRGEVRRGRQASDEEGHGQGGDELQERVRGVDRDRRGRAPGHQGADGGEQLQRSGADHRVLAVPAARNALAAGNEPPGGRAAQGGGVRLLAAVPVRSAPRGEGREPVPAGFQEAEGQGR